MPKVTVRLFGEEDKDALNLGGYLREAYQEAEEFSKLLQNRVKGAGFFKTLLLRRMGSSMEAGRRTLKKLLGPEPDLPDDEDDEVISDDLHDRLLDLVKETNLKPKKRMTKRNNKLTKKNKTRKHK